MLYVCTHDARFGANFQIRRRKCRNFFVESNAMIEIWGEVPRHRNTLKHLQAMSLSSMIIHCDNFERTDEERIRGVRYKFIVACWKAIFNTQKL